MAHWKSKFALVAALSTAAFSSTSHAQIPVNMERTPIVEAQPEPQADSQAATTPKVEAEVVPAASPSKAVNSSFDQLQVVPPVNPFRLPAPALTAPAEAFVPTEAPELTPSSASPSSTTPGTEVPMHDGMPADSVLSNAVVPVISGESIGEVDPPASPTAQARLADVRVLPPATDNRTTIAPALILRPTESNPQMINDCVVEVTPRSDAQPGYQLRIAVPDSVSAIEVVPSGATQRNFRIQLDEHQATQQVQTAPAAPLNRSNETNGSDDDAGVQLTDPSAEVLSNASSHDAGLKRSQALRESLQAEGANSPYKINPFYQQQFASSRASARETRVELTNAQIDVGAKMPRQVETRAIPMDTPSLDIPFEEIGAEKLRSESPASSDSEMDELAELEILDHASDAMTTVSVEPFGPATMTNGSEADFTVVLRNQGEFDVDAFDLRLSLPEGMQVTVLDRPADFDAKYQTVTWRIPGLQFNETMSIRYRVKSLVNGRHTQALETGRGGLYSNLTTLSTNAASPSKR